MTEKPQTEVKFISINGDQLLIELDLSLGMEGPALKIGELVFPVKPNPRAVPRFIASIPVNLITRRGVEINTADGDCSFLYGKFTGLSNRFLSSFNVIDGFTFYQSSVGGLQVKKYSRFDHLFRELRYILVLLISRKKAAGYRIVYWLAKPFFANKNIWMFSDRPYTAGDNAEYLFRHTTKVASLPSSFLPIFAVNKSHESFNRLKAWGRTVPFGGVRYTILSLLASKRISSHFDEYIINPLGGGELCYDLNRADYIYLEHGVLTSDSSGYFGRGARNAKMITVASENEKLAIIKNSNYGYTENEVAVTGHARFDGLRSKESRTIVIMPSWRESIAGSSSAVRLSTRKEFRAYSSEFKGTDYYAFYSSLLQNEQLQQHLEKANCFIEFYIHPSFAAQWVDFIPSQRVHINQPPHDYTKALSEGALMITDYSGVAFDFAYMKKPVIYTQFDYDTLYENHYYKKGYFSFKSQGFGPILYSVEGAVREIMRSIDNNFTLEDKYKKRVDDFFYKIDNHNSERILKEVFKP